VIVDCGIAGAAGSSLLMTGFWDRSGWKTGLLIGAKTVPGDGGAA